MTELFGEPSLRVLLWSLFLIFLFTSIYVMTKRRWTLYVVGSVVVILIFLVVVERLIVTDREKLRANLQGMAAAVRQNDAERLKQFVSARRADVKQRIDIEMRHAQFRDCRVLGERPIEFDRSGPRPIAHYHVSVYAVVDAVSRHNFVGSGTGNARLTFEKEADGQWRLIDYEVADPRLR